jgi:DNA-binding MarR family transcriptional regulator
MIHKLRNIGATAQGIVFKAHSLMRRRDVSPVATPRRSVGAASLDNACRRTHYCVRLHASRAQRREEPPNMDQDPTPTALRAAVRALIATFGLLEQDSVTPCGVAIPLMHAHALMALAEHGAPMSVQQLTAHLRLDRSSVSRLCARMEEAGHISRDSAPHDARARALTLTERGVKLAQNLQRSSLARFESIHEAMPADQRGAVLDALHTLERAISSTRTQDPQAP